MEVIDKFGRRRMLKPGEILQDGERVAVRLTAMDHRPAVTDGFGRPAGHRPGPLYRGTGAGNGAEERSSEAERDAYKRRLSNAWRGTPITSTADNQSDSIASREMAYDEYCARVSEAWKAAR